MTGDVETNPGPQSLHTTAFYTSPCTKQLWVLSNIHYAMNCFTRLNKHPHFWILTENCMCVQACVDSFVLSTRDQVLYSTLAFYTVSLETLCLELNY